MPDRNVDAIYLTDSYGSFMIDPSTGGPVIVPASYFPENAIQSDEMIKG